MANRTLPEILRQQRLAISVLIELVQNGQQIQAATQITAIKAVIDQANTDIAAATNATITTL